MRKSLKKVLSASFCATMIATMVAGFAQVPVKAEEGKSETFQSIFYDFVKLSNEDELTVGKEYLLLPQDAGEYGEGEAIAELLEGSGVVEYGGKDIDTVTFNIFENLKTYESAKAYYKKQYGKVKLTDDFLPTEEEVEEWYGGYDAFWEEEGEWLTYYLSSYGIELSEEDTASYEALRSKLNQYNVWDLRYSEMFGETLEDMLEYFNSRNYEYEEELLTTWDDIVEQMGMSKDYVIEALQYEVFEDSDNEDYEGVVDGYLAVIERGVGFDGCGYGFMKQFEYNGVNGWWYGCYGGGVDHVGPFDLYSYTESQFSADDLEVVFKDGFEIPEEETEITYDDVDVTIIVGDRTVVVPFYSISGKNNSINIAEGDKSITVNVGAVTKEVTILTKEELENKLEERLEEKTEETVGKPLTEDKKVVAIEGEAVGKAPEAEITGISDTVKDTLLEMINTDPAYVAEKEAIENGEKICLYLKTEDISDTITKADKDALDNKKGDLTIGMYIDASFFLKVGDNDAHSISNPGGEVTIVIDVPAELQKDNRTYSMIHTHGDRTEVLATVYDAIAKTLTFKVKDFSSFAIAYKDAISSPETPTDATTSTTPQVPQTGDVTNVAMWMVLLAACAVAAVACTKKRVQE